MILRMRADGIYPVSNNDMYIPTRGRGSNGAFLRRSRILNEFQNTLWSKILDQYSNDISKFLDMSKCLYSHLGFKVKLWIGMNDMFYKRNPNDLRPYDSSNYIKAIEDTFARIFEYDDKYNMEFWVCKYDIELETWRIDIEYEPVDYMNYIASELDLPRNSGVMYRSGDQFCKYCIYFSPECKKCTDTLYKYWIRKSDRNESISNK